MKKKDDKEDDFEINLDDLPGLEEISLDDPVDMKSPAGDMDIDVNMDGLPALEESIEVTEVTMASAGGDELELGDLPEINLDDIQLDDDAVLEPLPESFADASGAAAESTSVGSSTEMLDNIEINLDVLPGLETVEINDLDISLDDPATSSAATTEPAGKSNATNLDISNLDEIDFGVAPEDMAGVGKPSSSADVELDLGNLPAIDELDGLNLDDLPSLEEEKPSAPAPKPVTGATTAIPKAAPQKTPTQTAGKKPTQVILKPATQATGKTPTQSVGKAPTQNVGKTPTSVIPPKEAPSTRPATAPKPGGGGRAAGDPDNAQPMWNVFLTKVADSDRRALAIEKLVNLVKMPQRDAEDLMEQAVIPIAKGVTRERAEFLVDQFKMIQIVSKIIKKKS